MNGLPKGPDLYENETLVPAHQPRGGVFGLFEVARPVEVKLQVGFNVQWVDVRPLSAGVVTSISPDHSTVTFSLERPISLTVEFNGDLKRVIHLLRRKALSVSGQQAVCPCHS